MRKNGLLWPGFSEVKHFENLLRLLWSMWRKVAAFARRYRLLQRMSWRWPRRFVQEDEGLVLRFVRRYRTPAALAQLVEHLICNQGVAGSNPAAGTNEIKDLQDSSLPTKSAGVTPG